MFIMVNIFVKQESVNSIYFWGVQVDLYHSNMCYYR